MKIKRHKIIGKFTFVVILLTILIGGTATSTFAQRKSVKPPRVEGQTTVGTINGQPITGNDLILMINSDSPFMPPLDGSPVPFCSNLKQIIPQIRLLHHRRFRQPRRNLLLRVSAFRFRI